MTANSIFLGDPDRKVSTQVANEIIQSLLGCRSASGIDPSLTRHELHDVQFQQAHPAGFLAAYEDICRRLEKLTALNPQLIVWHLPFGESAGLFDGEPSYGRLCAMLTLSLPEVLFLPVNDLPQVMRACQLMDASFDPLFDGAGYRNDVRELLKKDPAEKFSYLPVRTNLAVAIDDECAYALFHSYTAFRFGFKAVAISTEQLSCLILGEEPGLDPLIGKPIVTFEDLYLSFPDQRKTISLSSLKKRQTFWPLSGALHRIFITSDQGEDTWEDNVCCVRSCSVKGCPQAINIQKFNKPHSGMFGLWDSAGFFKEFRPRDGGAPDGYAPDFIWPPPDKQTQAQKGDHSCPGAIKLVAERLIDRAARMLTNAQSMSDCVKGSVLATDACELLGAQTPTLAIEALRLKHNFEVLTECQFSGVEYHIPLARRFAEMRRDLALICRWFGEKTRESATLNAEMAILTALVRVFRNFGQFDEEQICLKRVRELHHQLWFVQVQKKWYSIFSTGSYLLWPLRILMWYLRFLLSSFPKFVLTVIGWVLAVGFLLSVTAPEGFTGGYTCGLQGALITMFTSGKPEGYFAGCDIGELRKASAWFGAVATVAIVAGYLHLAVLVAHLYTTVNRR